MKAVVTIGVSASGKTTWANTQNNVTVISRDDARRVILEQRLKRKLNPGELWSKWKFGKDEAVVTDICWNNVCGCAARGYDIIIADTNLNKSRNEQLKVKLESLGYDVEFKVFDITLEEAWKRDSGRQDGVGHIVLAKQYQQYLELIDRRKYVADQSLPKTVIFDVDGTIAEMSGRGAYDWDKVGTDIVRDEIADMLRGFHSQGYRVVIMSGRDGVCEEDTKKWMFDNEIPFDAFFIRTAGDMRKDAIIKEELFWAHVAPYYNVRLVVDDRKQVVRFWQDIGLRVADVGRYYEEF